MRARWRYCEVKRATPFGFALMVERFREKLTTEKLSDRVGAHAARTGKGGRAVSARELLVAGETLLLLAQKALYWPSAEDADHRRHPLRQSGLVPRAGHAGAARDHHRRTWPRSTR